MANEQTISNNEAAPKAFAMSFLFTGDQIQIQMKANKVSAHEMIGLLEMAKKQILDGMTKK